MNDTLCIKELSEYLKCSISLIRKYVRNKEIPFFRIGNRLYFKKESIDLWIHNQEISNMQIAEGEATIHHLKSEVS